MQIIDTKTHGYIDYIFGITLIAMAYLLNFNSEGTPNIALYIVGTSAIVYSLFTNYELGVIKIIPINIHLMLGQPFRNFSCSFFMVIGIFRQGIFTTFDIWSY